MGFGKKLNSFRYLKEDSFPVVDYCKLVLSIKKDMSVTNISIMLLALHYVSSALGFFTRVQYVCCGAAFYLNPFSLAHPSMPACLSEIISIWQFNNLNILGQYSILVNHQRLDYS